MDAVAIRSIQSVDAAALEAFHGRLSERSVYLRFFSPHPRLSADELHRFTEVDHRDREALVAIADAAIAGVARYDRMGAGVAEVAVVVEDAWQGRGVGTALLAALAVRARSEGIETFVAETLVENGRMRRVFAHMGWPAQQSFNQGVIEYHFALAAAEVVPAHSS